MMPRDDKLTVRAWCENLAVMDGNDRQPLTSLAVSSHVHGGLRLEFAGRLVPYLGYWGPDDVCFGQWLGELSQAALALTCPGGRHLFEEGEQGQPAFVFERDGDRGYFSIAASEISGAGGDPEWQRVEFSPTDFIEAAAGLKASFMAKLRSASPAKADAWLAQLNFGPNG